MTLPTGCTETDMAAFGTLVFAFRLQLLPHPETSTLLREWALGRSELSD